ncbi:hypothetical protein DSM101010T_07930 [Desulfovibrio subterraneus]|uniref:Uncharacterized protein n=1 Tax=Desulfovibrio subterraneus TaxID=2718620 RepID=A0A7J0BFX2_9BACT|nr:hypothetical protein DSM101010T_07930 [Desulfovibrio subterraneus]
MIYLFNKNNHISQKTIKEVESMDYKKPEVLAQGAVQTAECRPNSKPSGRPCNPPGPGGR